MRRHLSHLVPTVLLALLVFSTPAAAADSPTTQNANLCSAYLTYLMRTDGSHFANRGQCTSYVAHGGSLRIGHCEVSMAAGATGFAIAFQSNPDISGLIPQSMVEFAVAVSGDGAPYYAFGCNVAADSSGVIEAAPCEGTFAPPSGVATPSYTAKLTITDITTGLLVAGASGSYSKP
jgi:hypothetical protein